MELPYYNNLNKFFEERLNDIDCMDETKAYLISTFADYAKSENNFSQCSATTMFAQARSKNDFLTYQSLGNWVFVCNSMFPEHLRFASKDYYDTIARLCYFSCFKMTQRRWKLFEQLADQYDYIEGQVKERLAFNEMTLAF